MNTLEQKKITIDIVSDVMCPWCIIGYKRLESAIAELGLAADIEVIWHPFELNPSMPPEGEEMVEHLSRKYGMIPEESVRSLQSMARMGYESGFPLDFFPGMHIVNTRDTHRALHFAKGFGLQTALKLRLFTAYFQEAKDVSDRTILLQEAEAVGLDREATRAALDDVTIDQQISLEEEQWRNEGVYSVPTMIFGDEYAVSGAQPVEEYKEILQSLLAGEKRVSLSSMMA